MSKTGFLHAEGKKFIDRNGNEIQLRGVALGNWLLLEGYMWGFMTTACTREWLIQDALRQLVGPEEAEKFFPAYRDAFVTETDIRMIAEMGFNSIRIPFNWKHFMHEGPGIRFKEEGPDVRLLVTLAATDADGHIEVMRQLATMFGDPENITKICEAATADEVYHAFADFKA